MTLGVPWSARESFSSFIALRQCSFNGFVILVGEKMIFSTLLASVASKGTPSFCRQKDRSAHCQARNLEPN